MTDPITLRVAERFKNADAPLWTAALKEVQAFNKRYNDAQKLNSPIDPKGTKVVNGFALGKKKPFYEWVKECCPESADQYADSYLDSEFLDGVVIGKTPIPEFLQALERYKNVIQSILNDVASESFTYQGFTVTNTHHMSDTFCRKTLEGVDYLVALFKTRGCESLLDEGLKEILLVPTNVYLNSTPNAAGQYLEKAKRITLSGSIARKGLGRFIAWVNEVFLHEFGHYIHLDYLAPEARGEWDAGWLAQTGEGDLLTVTQADRKRFFSILKDNSFNLLAAYLDLKGDDKARFQTWLGPSTLGAAVVEPSGKIGIKQTRWGNHIIQMLKNPEREVQYGLNVKPTHPDFAATVTEFSEKALLRMGLDSPVTLKVPKDKAEMQNLDIVSDYGKTNEKEDFAETFVAFMGAPEKLTPTSKFRMQRALSLSGLYGKPVMRLAIDPTVSAVVDRYTQAILH